MGACSQIVALITKNAVQSTAFLLHIAEDSGGKALSGADFVCGVANPASRVYSVSTSNHNPCDLSLILMSVVPYSVSTSNHNNPIERSNPVNVVPYSVSTSNHNLLSMSSIAEQVVPYSVSTSNHNQAKGVYGVTPVVPYSVSTSNHNLEELAVLNGGLFLILFLHQTTTIRYLIFFTDQLFLILFLHQTTTLHRST